MPMAMENLSIAQHQDTLRYAHTRGDSYKLKILLCDNCNGGYHLFCLKPKFIQVLVDIWYCSSCFPTTP
ncbi:unnamed protein product [Sphagnum jensenii]|uniref:PHD-type domain-containing protein n=1 Tax=Sphagnum jensenii TaxID=128206 RepID=A0ABP0X0S5_9BRYO